MIDAMTDTYSSPFNEWQKEKEFLDKERIAHPELFLSPVLVDDNATLKSIGIENAFGARTRGHIKLFPEDFIVEEVSKDETLHTIDDGSLFLDGSSPEEEIRTIWADLVKMGLDTIEVVNELSRHLGIDKKFIGTAGIKDKHALTSQAISFRGVKPDALSLITAPNFFLKNLSFGKGALQVGDLLGNRFTIYIRMLEHQDKTQLHEALRDLEEQGFWNFFYLQRFGTPRLISHRLGLLILQGKFEETVRMSLTTTSEREIPYYQEFRKKLLPLWGDWSAILAEINKLPYSFKSEKKMLEHLAGHPGDFIGALNMVPEQIKLWVYAYASYLFNKTLSRLIAAEEDISMSLPLALSRDPRNEELYGDFFKAHKIAPPFSSLRNFPYVQKPEKDIETLKKFTLHGVETTDSGVVLDFFLEKASYATTFLSHLFVLSQGQPVPEGISTEEVDTKMILGGRTIQPLRDGKLKKLFEMRKLQEVNKEESGE